MDSITPGTVFAGRYEILSKLGEGGFGQVFKARQHVTLQEVAIKVLRDVHSANASHVARFQREMQLCAQLYHPHIVRLIDSGRTDAGAALQRLRVRAGADADGGAGEREERCPAWEAAQLMLQVLDALELRPQGGGDPPGPQAPEHHGLPHGRAA